MKKWMLCICALILVQGAGAQTPDTVKTNERKVQWLVGADALSALNFVSVIGGIESNRSRYSLSLSHLSGSSRIGVYYDYYISKKYRVLAGIGFHNSFLFSEFKKSRAEYKDSLIKYRTESTLGNGAFLPSAAEVRHQYFISASLAKEFKIIKGLFINLKLSGLLVINPFYDKVGVSGIYGLQLYYKW